MMKVLRVYLTLPLGLLLLTGCPGGGGSNPAPPPPPANAAPVASDTSVTTDEDVAAAVTLSATDEENDTLSFDYTPPAHGTLSGTAPDLLYTPEANYYGVDSFTFTVSDGNSASNAATVNITVNPVNDALPVANDLAVTTDEDTSLAITLTATDVDNDTLTYSHGSPSSGALTGTPPNLTYTPNANWYGMDSFTFTANDGSGDSNVATVTIGVQSVNDPPAANAGVDQTYNGGETVYLSGSGSDIENDALTYTWAQRSGPPAPLGDPTSRTPEFMVPVAGGDVVFELTVSDGNASSQDTVTITGLPYGGTAAAALEVNPFLAHAPATYIRDVAVYGTRAYVLADYTGLQIYDVSDPANPTLLGSQWQVFQTGSRAIQVVGNYAYILVAGYLRIYNVSSPSSLTEVGAIATPGSAEELFVASGYAFVADGASGLRIYNVNTPSVPILVGTYNPGLTFTNVTLSGGYAYLAAGNDGLVIVNISNLASPSLTGSLTGIGAVNDVAVYGTTAYASVAYSGTRVVNVANRATPTLLSTISTYNTAVDLVIAGTTLYVAEGEAGVQLYDVSTPTSPVRVGQYNGANEIYAGITDVAVSGSYIYAAQWGWAPRGGLYVFDARTPQLPSLMSHYDIGDWTWDVVAQEARGALFVAAQNGLHVLDITSPPAIGALALQNSKLYLRGIDAAGSKVYTSGSQGLNVYDASVLTAPTLQGSQSAGSGYGEGVSYAGDHVFYAAGPSGLPIFDVSDPAIPNLVGTFSAGVSRINAVKVAGDHAFVADWGNGLEIIDITDKTLPTLVGAAGGIGIALDVDVTTDGGQAYTACDRDGLSILDVGDKTAPTVLGNYNLYSAQGVTGSGGYAYVGNEESGLYIVDVSDPTTPTLAGLYSTPGQETGRAAVTTGYVYIADGRGGLQVGLKRPGVNRYETASPGATLSYNLDWIETEDPRDEQVKCFVTGGSCTVTAVNTSANTAQITWALPGSAGDHEILFTVGTQHYFISEKDRVQVQ